MKKEKETGRFASTLSNVEVDEREEERMQFQQAIAQEQQARQAVQQQHREEMLHLQEEANRRHQEAMAEQRKEMQIQMAAMQQQFQQMMMAAAAGATQGPPPVPTSQSEEWMDPVDISNGPVPDGAGSSWIGGDCSVVDSVDCCVRENDDSDWLPPSLVELGQAIVEGWQFVESLHNKNSSE